MPPRGQTNEAHDFSRSNFFNHGKKDHSRVFKNSSYNSVAQKRAGTGTNFAKPTEEAYENSRIEPVSHLPSIIPEQFQEGSANPSPWLADSEKRYRSRLYIRQGGWYADIPKREEQLESVLNALKSRVKTEETCTKSSPATQVMSKVTMKKLWTESPKIPRVVRSRNSSSRINSFYAGARFTCTPTPNIVPNPPARWKTNPQLTIHETSFIPVKSDDRVEEEASLYSGPKFCFSNNLGNPIPNPPSRWTPLPMIRETAAIRYGDRVEEDNDYLYIGPKFCSSNNLGNVIPNPPARWTPTPY